MIDIHNHYLFGVDDGAQTLDDSLELVNLAVEQGITHVVCTSHYHHGRFDWDQARIDSAYETLSSTIREKNIPLRLSCAAEVRFSDLLLVDLKQGVVPFVGQWKGKDALLLEMPHQQVPSGIDVFIRWLLKEGIQPIIAHPERNKGIMRDIRSGEMLVRAGALFQVTAGSIAGAFGERARDLAYQMLEQNWVQFVASDAHNKKRPPAMAAAKADLSETLGEGADALVEQLMIENPGELTACLFEECA